MNAQPMPAPVFQITGRRLAILTIYLFLIGRGLIPFLQRAVPKGMVHPWLVVLFLSPVVLAFLVALLDRPGPVRNWATWCLLSLVGPVLVLNHDAVVVADYLVRGQTPILWATLLLNATLVPVSLLYFVKMVPRACPSCGRRALIPLMRLWKKDKRTAQTRWCASCGGKYWKDRAGQWRVERRTTWLDGPEPPSPLKGTHTPHPSHEPKASV